MKTCGAMVESAAGSRARGSLETSTVPLPGDEGGEVMWLGTKSVTGSTSAFGRRAIEPEPLCNADCTPRWDVAKGRVALAWGDEPYGPVSSHACPQRAVQSTVLVTVPFP